MPLSDITSDQFVILCNFMVSQGIIVPTGELQIVAHNKTLYDVTGQGENGNDIRIDITPDDTTVDQYMTAAQNFVTQQEAYRVAQQQVRQMSLAAKNNLGIWLPLIAGQLSIPQNLQSGKTPEAIVDEIWSESLLDNASSIAVQSIYAMLTALRSDPERYDKFMSLSLAIITGSIQIITPEPDNTS